MRKMIITKARDVVMEQSNCFNALVTVVECDTALESASDNPVAVSGAEAGFEEQFKYIRVIDQFLPPPHNAALDVPHFCYIDIIDAAHFY
eukprot:m.182098 g.182098  ORF g.182098 m.182098 type:complete len:90 (+) comp18454_c0_seq1:752-1021(+)